MEEEGTRRRQTARRTEQILKAALELFCEQGIEETSIEEVARRAGAGPATVYRYFNTKAQLAVDCGIYYWEKIAGIYVGRLEEQRSQGADGLRQLQQIMEIFGELFEQEFSFLRFLYEFDAFVMKYQIPWERLAEYEARILDLKKYVTQALELGLADGSLSFSYTTDEVYFTLTHAMLSLMQKLAAGGQLLPSDQRVALSLQVKIAGELLIGGLRTQAKGGGEPRK